MHLAFWIVVLGITLTIGTGIGFNTANYLQKDNQQDQTATATGISLAALSYLGAAVSAGSMFRILNKDRKEEKEKRQLQKEEKRKAHYERDIKTHVLANWLASNNTQVSKMQPFDPIIRELYLQITSVIRDTDDHEEVKAHLDSGYKNENVYAAYYDLLSFGDAHNKTVNEFMNGLKQSITRYITENTPLIEHTGGDTAGYFYSGILYYIEKKAEKQQIALEIIPNVRGLARLRTDSHLDVAYGDEASLIKLKNYLESTQDDNITKLAELKENIAKMDTLVNSFKVAVKAMIHEADRSGLKGRCGYDDEIDKPK